MYLRTTYRPGLLGFPALIKRVYEDHYVIWRLYEEHDPLLVQPAFVFAKFTYSGPKSARKSHGR